MLNFVAMKKHSACEPIDRTQEPPLKTLLRWARALFVMFGFWAILCAWNQLERHEAVVVSLFISTALIVLISGLFALAIRRVSWAGASIIAFGAYLYVIGPTRAEIAAVCVSACISLVFRRWLKDWTWFACALIAWVLCSFAIYLDHPLPVNLKRFDSLRKEARHNGTNVAVSLSGGGYRAALFHAGVLAELEELKLVPSHISTVSGGSIIGAFYVEGGNPQDFLKAVQEGRFNLKRDLLAIQNLLRLPFPGQVPGTTLRLLPWFSFNRTDVQARLVDRLLFHGTQLFQLETTNGPVLMICATDLNTGRAIGLTKKGTYTLLTSRPLHDIEDQSGAVPFWDYRTGEMFFWPAAEEDTKFPQREKTADLVAASGAFPLAFESRFHTMQPTTQPSSFPFDEAPIRNLRLADGGLTDNTGVSLLLGAHSLSILEDHQTRPNEFMEPAIAVWVQGWTQDVIVVSDGGSILTEINDKRGPELMRAMDIVYSRVGIRTLQVDPDAPSWVCLPQLVFVSPQMLMTYPAQEHPQTSTVQEHIKALDDRTFDLLLSEFPVDAKFILERRQRVRGEADEAAYNLIAPRLRRLTQTFMRAETLRDNYSPDDAKDLFQLGRYLVLLHAAEIEHAVSIREAALDTCPNR
jgi:hypothetical protein